MLNVGASPCLEGTIKNMIDICTKYGSDMSLIISGSYGGQRRHTTDNTQLMMPRVWHKLPTGEHKIK